MKLLIFGIGNPGRQDDSLGVLFAEEMDVRIKKNNIDAVDVDSNYQLMAEDAHTISGYDRVYFVDATRGGIKDFRISKVEPSSAISFSTHSMSPGSVLALCGELYNKSPEVYALEIKGYEWEVNGELTEKARQNLEKALEALKKEIIEIMSNKKK